MVLKPMDGKITRRAFMGKKQQTALITGATSGIGAEYAKRFAQQGYDLIITGRRKQQIQALANELQKQYGVQAEVILVELSAPDQVDQLVQKIKSFENLSVLINNAGFSSKKAFHEENIASQVNMVAVQIIAAIQLTHAVIPRMLQNGSGIIINVSSMGAFLPLAENAVYSGNKTFLKNFSESLHLQLKSFNIRVQVVFPGFTRTDLGRSLGYDMHSQPDTLLQKWMDPEEVVNISLNDLKKRNKVLCIPGWGNKTNYHLTRLIPRSLWYRMAETIAEKMP
jgi:uncharacterized protein